MVKLSPNARTAANRFGLGIRPEEADAYLVANPKAWLGKQLDEAEILPASFAGLPGSHTVLPLLDAVGKDKEKRKQTRKALRQRLASEIHERMLHGITTRQSFRERLVHFWGNHFSVTAKNPALYGMAGAYEREAIRPHVTGYFEDMLLAVAQHPAMLLYLDNAASIGPNSAVGKRRKKSLNENLAREILELHTLGVNGGYTQNDVIALAKLITGWSVNRKQGGFEFGTGRHERGDIPLLGTVYADSAERSEQLARGEAALRYLARHPSTAQFIATKLARHFIADNPPEHAVTALSETYRKTGGNLRELYDTLIGLHESWDNSPTKLKSSGELIISAARLAGMEQIKPAFLKTSYAELGNPPFQADSPAGYADTASELLGPDVLMRRISWARHTARSLPFTLAPDSAAHLALGKSLHEHTYHTIATAGERETAYAFLLASPEFQWR